MKSEMGLLSKFKERKAVKKFLALKNKELIIAAVLCVVALTAYFLMSAGSKTSGAKQAVAAATVMTEEETRVSELLSKINGAGKVKVLITTAEDDTLCGVVVVAEGATDAAVKINLIRAVQTATGATVDKIQVFQMVNGG